MLQVKLKRQVEQRMLKGLSRRWTGRRKETDFCVCFTTTDWPFRRRWMNWGSRQRWMLQLCTNCESTFRLSEKVSDPSSLYHGRAVIPLWFQMLDSSLGRRNSVSWRTAGVILEKNREMQKIGVCIFSAGGGGGGLASCRTAWMSSWCDGAGEIPGYQSVKSELRGKHDGMAVTVEDNLHVHVFWGLSATGGDW